MINTKIENCNKIRKNERMLDLDEVNGKPVQIPLHLAPIIVKLNKVTPDGFQKFLSEVLTDVLKEMAKETA